MKAALLDILICPSCLPAERPLTLAAGADEHAADIRHGALCCSQCGCEYPIRDGVATLLPSGGVDAYNAKYEQPSALGTYQCSHYGDLAPALELDQSPYRQWATSIRGTGGLYLDAGCGLGRMAFERSSAHTLSVGVDLSTAFVAAARGVMQTGRVTCRSRIEGDLYQEVEAEIPGDWRPDRVEFLVADVTALPFRRCFAAVSSLNILDKVPAPWAHLAELDRVALDREAELLLSDPFSWSEEVAPRSAWLGGTAEGPYAGRGLDNVRRLLSEGAFTHPWSLDEPFTVEWRLRNHANHAEDIRSQGFRAAR